MLKRLDMHRVSLLRDSILRLKNLIHALHRGETLRNIVTSLGKFLKRIDDTIQDYHVIDECRTRESIASKDQHTAKPKDDNDHHRAEKLRHRVSHLLTNVHSHDIVPIAGIDSIEAGIHLVFSTERLDDAQSAKRFLHLTHRIAP